MKIKLTTLLIILVLLVGGGLGAYFLLKDKDIGVIKTTKNDSAINIQENNEKINKLEKEKVDLEQKIEDLEKEIDNSKKEFEVANKNKSEENKKLTDDELKYFTDYLNKSENNCLLTSEYYNAKDIDLRELIYTGAGIEQEDFDKIEKEYKEEIDDFVTTDITKWQTSQIIEFFKDKTGITLTSDDIKKALGTTYYSKKYDAYYIQHGDTNYVMMKCIKGYKTYENKYVITYVNLDDFNNKYYDNDTYRTITLQKNGDKYEAISNF